MSQLDRVWQAATETLRPLKSISKRAFFLTGTDRGVIEFSKIQARSSGGERYLDTVEVVGSNPIVPTRINKGLQRHGVVSPFILALFSQTLFINSFRIKF